MLWIGNLCPRRPNPQYDGFWRWGLWEVERDEVMRAGPWPRGIRALLLRALIPRGQGPVGLELLEEETPDSLLFCPLPHLWCGHAHKKRSCEHMTSKGPSASQEESLHQKAILLAPWSWTSSLQNCGRIKIHCLSHPVGYFVVAATAKTERHR